MLFLFMIAVAALALVAILARLAVARLLSVPGLAPMRVDPPYREAPLWKRVLVRTAGPLGAWAAAAILFAALAAQPRPVPSTTVDPVPGAPAALAGVRSGDEVVAVAGHPVTTWHELVGRVREASTGPMTLTVRRGGASIDLRVTPGANGMLGVQAHVVDHAAKPGAVLDAAVLGPWRMARDTVADRIHAIERILGRHGSRKLETVAGPVGVLAGRHGPSLLTLACRVTGPALPMAMLVDLFGVALLIRYAGGTRRPATRT